MKTKTFTPDAEKITAIQNQILLNRMKKSLASMAEKITDLQAEIPEQGYEPFGEDNNPWKMDWDFLADHTLMIEKLNFFMKLFIAFNGNFLFDFEGLIEEFSNQSKELDRNFEEEIHEEFDLNI